MPVLRRRFLYVFIVAALACSLPHVSKSKNKSQDKNADVKITSRTEMVLVPAVVTDKSGAHITGLKKEDFRVLENGAERKIATFEEISSDPHGWQRPSPRTASPWVAP